MAVISTRASAATLARLITLFRKAVGDRNGDRWTDADAIDFIDPVFAWMHNQIQSATPAAHETTEEVEYAASAESVEVPEGYTASQIYFIEDISSGTEFPIFVYYVAPDEVGRNRKQVLQWTFLNGQIAIHPQPSISRTLRVHFLANWFTATAAEDNETDQQPYNVNFEELIWLKAAATAQEIDGEVSKGRRERIAQLEAEFIVFADRYHGKTYVQDVRNFY